MDSVGIGWKLVRRTKGNSHSATDHLTGTEVYGNPTSPMGDADFSVSFETAVPGWDEILLATGSRNHWMIMSKTASASDVSSKKLCQDTQNIEKM